MKKTFIYSILFVFIMYTGFSQPPRDQNGPKTGQVAPDSSGVDQSAPGSVPPTEGNVGIGSEVDQTAPGGFHFDMMNVLIGLVVGGAVGFLLSKNMSKKDS